MSVILMEGTRGKLSYGGYTVFWGAGLLFLISNIKWGEVHLGSTHLNLFFDGMLIGKFGAGIKRKVL